MTDALVGGALGLFGSLASLLFGLVIVIFIPLYLTANPESAVSWTMRLFPAALRSRRGVYSWRSALTC